MNFNPTKRCVRIALGIVVPVYMTFAQQVMKPPPIRPTMADFASGIHAAGESTTPAPKRTRKHSTIRGTIHAAPAAPVIVERSIPLTESETEALRISHQALNNESAPSAGPNGVVVYTYGEGIPTDICAPMQISQINLEPGEEIQLNDQKVPMMDLGDWPNWVVTPYSVGDGDSRRSYLIVKPKFSGMETTLSVPTNKRTYYIHLVSEPREYIPQMSFRYPEEEHKEKLAAYAESQVAAKKKQDEAAHLKELDTLRPIRSTAYSVELNKAARKHAPYLRPLKVYDDGAHTIIQLPEAARHHDLPVIQLSGYTGTDTPNIHPDPKTLTYTIDSLVEQVQLLVGTGRHQLKVVIKNEGIMPQKDLYAENR